MKKQELLELLEEAFNAGGTFVIIDDEPSFNGWLSFNMDKINSLCDDVRLDHECKCINPHVGSFVSRCIKCGGFVE